MINRKYVYEDVLKAVGDSKSIANVLKLIGLIPKGGNYSTIKKYINDNNIDITHFTGQGHNVGDSYTRIKEEIPIKFYLVNGLMTSSYKLKQRLIDKNIKQHCCEVCNLDEWCGNKIPLELHHVDGNHFNNELSNIQLLCPNCHANTPNYRGKNIVTTIIPKTLREMYPEFFVKLVKKEKVDKVLKEKIFKYCDCGEKIKNSSKKCVKCHHDSLKKIERPDRDILLKEIKEKGYSATGRKYGVSDNAIRKWVK